MDAPLIIFNNMYSDKTVQYWSSVWDHICRMSYERKDIVEEIHISPGILRVEGVETKNSTECDHSRVYNEKRPLNDRLITLDYTWSLYSRQIGTQNPMVVPELKTLVVPRVLFESLGIRPWFNFSFPNCRIFFWDE